MSSNEVNLQVVLMLANSAISVGFSFLPILFENRGMSNVEIGLLAIPFSISLIIANSFFGKISDNHDRKPFLLIGLSTSSLGMIGYLFPQTFAQFVFIRILNGVTMGIYPAALTAIASDSKFRLGKLSSFGSLGWALGAYFGGVVAMISNLDIAFLLSGIAFIVAFIVALRMQVPDNIVVQKTFEKLYLKAIRKNYPEYLFMIMRHSTANAIWIYWALFLQKDLGLSLSQIGFVQLSNMGTQYLVMQAFTDRYDPKKMFVGGGFLSSIAFFSFPFAQNFIQIAAMQIILGFSWAFFYVGGLRSVENNGKEDGVVATSTGLFNASISVAYILGPLLALYLYSISETYTLIMDVAGWITLISLVLYIIYSRFVHNS